MADAPPDAAVQRARLRPRLLDGGGKALLDRRGARLSRQGWSAACGEAYVSGTKYLFALEDRYTAACARRRPATGDRLDFADGSA